jgi:hypothetical protein
MIFIYVYPHFVIAIKAHDKHYNTFFHACICTKVTSHGNQFSKKQKADIMRKWKTTTE